jgi:hypothetical protein
MAIKIAIIDLLITKQPLMLYLLRIVLMPGYIEGCFVIKRSIIAIFIAIVVLKPLGEGGC